LLLGGEIYNSPRWEKGKDMMTNVRELKYIIFEAGTLEIPVLFPSYINHSDIKCLEGAAIKVSAGMTQITGGGQQSIQVSCYGESISLKIKSRTGDSGIIRNLLLESY
jgi:hypothetical protein